MLDSEPPQGSPPSALKRSFHRSNTSLLKRVNAAQQVQLTFTNVCTYVPVLSGVGSQPPKSNGGESSKERQVLFDVSGTIAPGTFMALMGPSGSGKSTLLSVLAGRSPARTSGEILYNGQTLVKSIKRKLAFVQQDDLLYAELTAYETLYYAALLRLPSTWTKAAKLERVEMVLSGLGLSKCRDTIIGSTSMRGVSGGERKRVSIGHELLINPSVLYLDEPTSGLDSTTALKLVHTLRGLATGGRVILASIHQPSSRLYQELDKLVLLSDGHPLYYGDAHAVAEWVALCGQPVPFGVSIPDHLLDLACGDLPDHPPSESKEISKNLVALFKGRNFGLGPDGVQPGDFSSNPDHSSLTPSSSNSSIKGRQAAGSGAVGRGEGGDSGALGGLRHRSEAEMQVSVVKMGGDAEASAVIVEMGPVGKGGESGEDAEKGGQGEGGGEGEEEEAASGSKWGASWLEQVIILTSRCVRTRRFQALSVQRFAEVLVTAVLAGLFWFQLGGKDTLDLQNITDLSGLLFFQVLFMSFSSMFQALFTFPADFAILKKERQSGMYRLSSYYAARSISEIPMDCAVPILFCIVIYFMAGLRLSAGFFFCNVLSTLLVMLAAQSVGLLLGTVVSNARTALAGATIFMLCTMLVGGYYVKNIPIWIRWLKYLSFIYWGYELLLKIEFGDRGYSCTDYYASHPEELRDALESAPEGSAAQLKTWCSIGSGNVVKTDVDASVGLDVGILFAMLVVVRIAVYMALKYKTSRL